MCVLQFLLDSVCRVHNIYILLYTMHTTLYTLASLAMRHWGMRHPSTSNNTFYADVGAHKVYSQSLWKRVNPFTADPVKALHFAILV